MPDPSVQQLATNNDPNINGGRPLLKHLPHYWTGAGDNLTRTPNTTTDVSAQDCGPNT